MITKRQIYRSFSRLSFKIKRNSPTILTFASVAGLIASVVSSSKASKKATLNEENKPVIQYYIPTILLTSATAASMITANVIGRKQYANAMATAIAIEKMYRDYKKKTENLVKDNVEHTYTKDDYPGEKVDGSDEFPLFYDPRGYRYFNRSMEEMIDANLNLNKKFIDRGFVSLNEYYDLLGLPTIESGDEIGWSEEAGYTYYNYKWIGIEYDLVTMDDGLECYVIRFTNEPTADYVYLEYPQNLHSVLWR